LLTLVSFLYLVNICNRNFFFDLLDDIIDDLKVRRGRLKVPPTTQTRRIHRSQNSSDSDDSPTGKTKTSTAASSKATKLYSSAIQNMRGASKLSFSKRVPKSSSQKSKSSKSQLDLRRSIDTGGDIFVDDDDDTGDSFRFYANIEKTLKKFPCNLKKHLSNDTEKK
jgi:hypothetical protein